MAKSVWKEHKTRESEAMIEKSADKSNAVKNHNFIVATFDLQALSLLYTPLAGDNQIYYKRKLAVYNFTVQES